MTPIGVAESSGLVVGNSTLKNSLICKHTRYISLEVLNHKICCQIYYIGALLTL